MQFFTLTTLVGKKLWVVIKKSLKDFNGNNQKNLKHFRAFADTL